MKEVILNNGVRMPMIGFGTWNVKDPRIIQMAIQNGYRLFDTARMYGNESIIAKGIALEAIPREQVFLTTKLDAGCDGYDLSLQAIDSSLERLHTDYIDLLLVHEVYQHPFAMYEACIKAYKQGKARAIGISNFRQEMYDKILQRSDVIPMVNQMESHIYYPQIDYAKYLKAHGTIMQAWGSLTEGTRNIFEEPVLIPIAKAHQKTTAQIALKYILQNNIGIIPKSAHQTRMQENLDLYDFELTNSEMSQIASLNQHQSLFDWY